MFWELSGDKGIKERPDMEKEAGRPRDPLPGKSLVTIVKVSPHIFVDDDVAHDIQRTLWAELRRVITGFSTKVRSSPICAMEWCEGYVPRTEWL